MSCVDLTLYNTYKINLRFLLSHVIHFHIETYQNVRSNSGRSQENCCSAAEVVGSNPTRSTFINLVKYGIDLAHSESL